MKKGKKIEEYLKILDTNQPSTQYKGYVIFVYIDTHPLHIYVYWICI